MTEDEATTVMLAATEAAEVTALALTEKARADFRALGEKLDVPASLLERFANDGAASALSEAYVRLTGEQLAGEPDDAVDDIIWMRQKLLADGIRIFRRDAQEAAARQSQAEHAAAIGDGRD